MVLNTYAQYLTYFTIPPRVIHQFNNAFAFTLPKKCSPKTGRVWVGYDEGARFEATCTVWLSPKTATGFGANIYLGGVYMHKHNVILPPTPNTTTNISIPEQNDFHHLDELDALAPYFTLNPVAAGSVVFVNREMFNIEPLGNLPFDAWDCEPLLVVDE